MARVPIQRLDDPAFACVYNTNRFSEIQMRELLDQRLEPFFRDRQTIRDSGETLSFQSAVDGEPYFVKEFRRPAWYSRIRDSVGEPKCLRGFRTASRLLKAELPAPQPIFAVAFTDDDPRCQVLVAECCIDAVPLDRYLEKTTGIVRRAFVAELADLLTGFHAKGFHSHELEAAKILAREDAGTRKYWITGLHHLAGNRLNATRHFVRTVAVAGADLHDALVPEERNYLLAACFDYALKKNIYSRPSQQDKFTRSVISKIRKRGGTRLAAAAK